MECYSVLFVLTCLMTLYAICYSIYRQLFMRDDSESSSWFSMMKDKTEDDWRVEYAATGILFLVTLSLGSHIYGKHVIKRFRKANFVFSFTVFVAISAFPFIPSVVLVLLVALPVLVVIYRHSIDSITSFYQLLFKVFGWLLIVSIPWEYMRLYHHQRAVQISQSIQGIPRECQMSSAPTLWNSFTVMAKDLFSWDSVDQKCLQYHKAILTDPLWEVTPAIAFVSLMTRCVVHPLGVIADTIGFSFQQMFQHIPLQWQPILLLIMVALGLLLAVMFCGYKINIMHVFSIEQSGHSSHHVNNRPAGDCVAMNSCTNKLR